LGIISLEGVVEGGIGTLELAAGQAEMLRGMGNTHYLEIWN
jgi:hypothetical protein